MDEKGSGAAQANDAAAAAPGEFEIGDDLRERQEALLDEAVQETFPASDPVSVARVPLALDDPEAHVLPDRPAG